MAAETQDEMQARLTNYEEGMMDLATAIRGGTLTPDQISQALLGLIGLPGQEHLKALRDAESGLAALMAFKDWALQELTKDACTKCGGTEGRHHENCPVVMAIGAQDRMQLLDIRGTILERLQNLQAGVADFIAATSEPDDPQEMRDLKDAYGKSLQPL